MTCKEEGTAYPTSEVDSSQQSVIVVETGSRLHFGLIDVEAPFGGIGVMLGSPLTGVRLESSPTFCPPDSAAERVTQIAERFRCLLGNDDLPNCKIQILARPRPHTGLGSGTQLGMAVAEAMNHFLGEPIPKSELGDTIAERGTRSAIGIHGYFGGGFVFEASDGVSSVNPVRERLTMPKAWCVCLLRSNRTFNTVSGEKEACQFDLLPCVSESKRNALVQRVTDEIIPAIQVGDFKSFCEGVQVYNHDSGMLFAPVQGGPYNGRAVSQLIDDLIDRGAKGVGQSSWGPTVFCWFSSQEEAVRFFESDPIDAEVMIAFPRNDGRMLQVY